MLRIIFHVTNAKSYGADDMRLELSLLLRLQILVFVIRGFTGTCLCHSKNLSAKGEAGSEFVWKWVIISHHVFLVHTFVCYRSRVYRICMSDDLKPVITGGHNYILSVPFIPERHNIISGYDV